MDDLSFGIISYLSHTILNYYVAPYTLYKIYLQPQWAAGVRGDIPETQSRTLEGNLQMTGKQGQARDGEVILSLGSEQFFLPLASK